jgi:hypothetical protein
MIALASTDTSCLTQYHSVRIATVLMDHQNSLTSSRSFIIFRVSAARSAIDFRLHQGAIERLVELRPNFEQLGHFDPKTNSNHPSRGKGGRNWRRTM